LTAADQVLAWSTRVASSSRCASNTRFVRFMCIVCHRSKSTRHRAGEVRCPRELRRARSSELLTLGRSFDCVRLVEPDFAQDDGQLISKMFSVLAAWARARSARWLAMA
jgi:hypothetical protein